MSKQRTVRCGAAIRGYTLIEVLVAMAVLSVVVTTTLGGLTLGARSREAVRAAGLRLAEVQTALTLYEQDLLHAFYRPAVSHRGPELAFAYGLNPNPSRLTLTTLAGLLPEGGRGARSVRVAWFRQGTSLVRTEWLYADRTPLTPSVKAVVLSGVRNYGTAFMDAGHEWRETWPSPQAPKEQDSLPRAARLQLELEDWGEIERIIILRAR